MQCSCVCIGIQQATQPRGSSAGKSGSRVLPHSPRTGCQRPPCCALPPPTRAVLTSSPQHTLLPRLGRPVAGGRGRGRVGVKKRKQRWPLVPFCLKPCLLVTGTGTSDLKPGCPHPHTLPNACHMSAHTGQGLEPWNPSENWLHWQGTALGAKMGHWLLVRPTLSRMSPLTWVSSLKGRDRTMKNG